MARKFSYKCSEQQHHSIMYFFLATIITPVHLALFSSAVYFVDPSHCCT